MRRKAATVLAVLAFAGVTQAESCEKAANDLGDAAGENDASYAPKIKRVKLGMTKAQVVKIMGQPPRDKQKLENATDTSEYLYYGSYQLVFENGLLESKNSY